MSASVKVKAKRPSERLRPLTKAEAQEGRERFRRFCEDGGWIGDHYEELLAKYPEEWIAVENKRVIAHDPDHDSFLRKVPDPAHTCTWFITKEPVDTTIVGWLMKLSEETASVSRTPRPGPRRRREKLRPLTRAERREVAETMLLFKEDSVWVDEHYQELLEKYPEQWIVVKNKTVIASDPDLGSLVARVPELPLLCREFITRERVEAFL